MGLMQKAPNSFPPIACVIAGIGCAIRIANNINPVPWARRPGLDAVRHHSVPNSLRQHRWTSICPFFLSKWGKGADGKYAAEVMMPAAEKGVKFPKTVSQILRSLATLATSIGVQPLQQ